MRTAGIIRIEGAGDIDEYVARLIANAPPLSAEHVERLRSLLPAEPEPAALPLDQGPDG